MTKRSGPPLECVKNQAGGLVMRHQLATRVWRGAARYSGNSSFTGSGSQKLATSPIA
jgi:hypothetical protein